MLRGGFLACLCLVVSLLGHAAGGGAVHVTAGLLAGGLVVAGSCIAVAGAQRGFVGILVATTAAQLLLHLLAGAEAHHGHAGAAPSGPGMITAHVLASLVVSAIVADGERLVWTLCALVTTRRLRALLDVTAPAPPTASAPAAVAAVPIPTHAFPRQGATWRGPPRS
ncbi:hypothetical protein CLV30_102410 [Haloactinopolyspora alba]|uniref:MFS transporter n=1 Tax=Haloactinopolyspora alba TaxID=648780 RepID=A0A2P8EC27_9ACTN|nr:hypothetical protein [Haloactinopolyspora alba]PSL07021.1 hypothetical protein CLV30_102410 [Haloactinopolyspora alba]